LEEIPKRYRKNILGRKEIYPIRGKFTAVQNKLEGAFKIG